MESELSEDSKKIIDNGVFFKFVAFNKANEEEIFDFLTLLSEKGEVSDEIAGGVYVLREKSKRDCLTVQA